MNAVGNKRNCTIHNTSDELYHIEGIPWLALVMRERGIKFWGNPWSIDSVHIVLFLNINLLYSWYDIVITKFILLVAIMLFATDLRFFIGRKNYNWWSQSGSGVTPERLTPGADRPCRPPLATPLNGDTSIIFYSTYLYF